jgi:hypothetical protein
MNQPPSLECEIHFDRQRRRKVIASGPPPIRPDQTGRVPRVARLMALAIRCDELIRAGEIENYAQLATLGHVTRARVSQIMSLLHLAPDLQEAVLRLPRTERGRDPIALRQLLPVAAIADWRKQRRLWRELTRECQ